MYFALQLADSFLQQAHINVEAHGVDVAVLLAAQQVPRPVQLQIERGNPKLCAQVAEFLQRRQPAPSYIGFADEWADQTGAPKPTCSAKPTGPQKSRFMLHSVAFCRFGRYGLRAFLGSLRNFHGLLCILVQNCARDSGGVPLRETGQTKPIWDFSGRRTDRVAGVVPELLVVRQGENSQWKFGRDSVEQ